MTMRLVKYNSVFLLCLLFFHTEALNCRSEGGPKQSDLKNIYNKCLKMQDNKNSSSSRDYGGNESKDQSRNNQRNNWDRDDNNDRSRSREERSGSRRDRGNKADGRMGTYDDRDSNSGYGENSGSYDGMDGKMGSHDSRMGTSSTRMDRYGNNRDDSMGDQESSYGNRDHSYNGRHDYQHSGYGSDMSNQYGYQSSTQPSRRYKRERHTENSGQRSQFNPNSKKSSSYDNSYQNYEKSMKENNTSKGDDKKACALHCFLENLEMTAEDGMPDRYLVTHTLTKDVHNEDLKDFLQESIEECFQMLDNESTDDKCEFSKNLLMCLSEKGRANCDDWKDDLRF